MSNQKNTTPVENTSEKTMTKYDRKMQARREAEALEKKRSLLTRIIAIAILALIVVIAVAVPVSKRLNAKKEFIRIGDHSINQIEYGFYYGYTANTFLSTYASILPYMGLDTSKDLSTQMYDENTTWAQYFNQLTLSSARQYLALADDAAANNFEYDFDAAYTEFYDNMKESADELNLSLNQYLKQVFGTYATKSTLKDAVTTFLTSQEYYTHLFEGNTPSTEEVTAYYNEHKDDYDSIDYRVFSFSADTEQDVDTEELAAAMADAKAKADSFVERVKAGEDFKTLCAEFAADDKKANYTGEKDDSLKEGTQGSSISSAYKKWLLDASRAAGDIAVVEDAENMIYYVVSFLAREYDAETQNEVISDTLAREATTEYLSDLTSKYEIVDEDNNVDLPVVNSTEDDNSTDAAEDEAATTPAAE